MPNKDDLQTLIDLPSGYVVEFNPWNKVGDAFVESGNVETTTDFLIALATELRDRREYQENLTQLIKEKKFPIYTFEAWQNAKKAGKL